MSSLRTRLFILWLAFSGISLALAIVLYGVYQQGVDVRVREAQATLHAACEAVHARYVSALDGAYRPALSSAGRDPQLERLMDASLLPFPGIEGGIWSAAQGFIAYGYPTHGSASRKTDIPVAEQPLIVEAVERATKTAERVELLREGQRETLLLTACPLPGAPTDQVVWVLKREAQSSQSYEHLLLGLGLLLAFVLISGGWLGWNMTRWSNRLRRIEKALANYPVDALPALPMVGEVELNRIVSAVNLLSQRLAVERESAKALAGDLARADRLAALGRLSAGGAHEIRNPIAAMRLKAENALAQPDAASSTAALSFLLGQVERLERLTRALLAMTQQLRLDVQPHALSPWLAEHLQAYAAAAAERQVVVRCEQHVEHWTFDALHLGRALDNLLDNAIRHAHGQVWVRAESAHGLLRLSVEDDGAGIDASLQAQLFEPFVSGRPDGSGLGLAIVHEIVSAHGGRVSALPGRSGARFELEIAWRTS